MQGHCFSGRSNHSTTVPLDSVVQYIEFCFDLYFFSPRFHLRENKTAFITLDLPTHVDSASGVQFKFWYQSLTVAVYYSFHENHALYSNRIETRANFRFGEEETVSEVPKFRTSNRVFRESGAKNCKNDRDLFFGVAVCVGPIESAVRLATNEKNANLRTRCHK